MPILAPAIRINLVPMDVLGIILLVLLNVAVVAQVHLCLVLKAVQIEMVAEIVLNVIGYNYQ